MLPALIINRGMKQMCNEPATVRELERQYINDEWLYLDAIELLVNKFGYAPKDAEALVETWEDRACHAD